FWLARAWDAVSIGDRERAQRAVSQGLEVSPANAELLILSGMLEVESNDVDNGAEALVSGFNVLAGSPRFRRYRAHAIALVRESGRPDIAARLLGASPEEDLLPPLELLSTDELGWLAESLLALGEVSLTETLLEHAPAHAPAMIDVRLQLAGRGHARDIVPLDEPASELASPTSAIFPFARTEYDHARLLLEDALYARSWDSAVESAAKLS